MRGKEIGRSKGGEKKDNDKEKGRGNRIKKGKGEEKEEQNGDEESSGRETLRREKE